MGGHARISCLDGQGFFFFFQRQHTLPGLGWQLVTWLAPSAVRLGFDRRLLFFDVTIPLRTISAFGPSLVEAIAGASCRLLSFHFSTSHCQPRWNPAAKRRRSRSIGLGLSLMEMWGLFRSYLWVRYLFGRGKLPRLDGHLDLPTHVGIDRNSSRPESR